MFRRRNKDFDREIQSHVELEADRLIEDGADPDEARAAARRRFGNVLASKERFYESRHWMWLDRLGQDTRYALRRLHRSRGFAVLVVVTLALGVGANTATFGVLNAVQWTTLPIDAPDRLWQLGWNASPDGFVRSYVGSGDPLPEGGRFNDPFPYRAYLRLAESATLFDAVIATMPVDLDVGIGGELHVVGAELVSGNYFRALGLDMALGRPIASEDDSLGAPLTAVVSHRFWRTTLVSNPSAIGQAITINQSPAVIVGVLPEQFFGIDPIRPPDLMVPVSAHDIARDRGGVLEDPFAWQFQVFGRLAPGTAPELAEREAERILGDFVDSSNPPADYVRPHVLLRSAAYGLNGVREAVSTTLLVLMAGVVLILVIACLNLAGLLASRSLTRHDEIRTRLALARDTRGSHSSC